MLGEIHGKRRIAGPDFWKDAQSLFAHFDGACRTIAEEHSDKKQLKGLKRFFAVMSATRKMKKAKGSFMEACLVRNQLGSKDTPQQLLEKLAGLKKITLG